MLVSIVMSSSLFQVCAYMRENGTLPNMEEDDDDDDDEKDRVKRQTTGTSIKN